MAHGHINTKIALFVALVLGLVIAVCAYRVSYTNEIQRHMTANLMVGSLGEACNLYRDRNGKFPSNQKELYQAMLLLPGFESNFRQYLKKDQFIEDPWGTPLSVENTAAGVTISSAGPDKQLGTQDDISCISK